MGLLTFTETLATRPETSYIIIYHSVDMNSRTTVEDIHRWHLKRGMAGIGYHFFIDKEGKVFAGRPILTKGAHNIAYNSNSVAICFGGDFTKEKMGAKQLSNEAIELLFLVGFGFGLNLVQDNGGMTELNRNPVTGEIEEIGGRKALLFFDELAGYQGAKMEGFPKDELKRRLKEYTDWFNAERSRAYGSNGAQNFNNWIISRFAQYGMNIYF